MTSSGRSLWTWILTAFGVARDEHRFAHLIQPTVGSASTSSRSPSRGSDDEDRLVAEALGLERVERGQRDVMAATRAARGSSLAAHGGERAAQQQLKALAAGVDDAGAAQDRQHRRRPRHRRRCLRTAAASTCSSVPLATSACAAAVDASRTTVRIVPSTGCDDSREGRLAALLEGAGELAAADLLDVGDGFAQAAEELRQDHAAVAARTHQRAQAERRRDARHGAISLGNGLGLAQSRLDRGQHVRARVPVGDREDVERVDLVDLRVEHGRRVAQRGEQAVAVPRRALGHRPPTVTVSASIGRPASR